MNTAQCDRKSQSLGNACGGCCSRIENVSVWLGNVQVLHDINLHIHCGELTTIVGPNGAGKTTLLRTLLGELPYHGTIEFHTSRTNQKMHPRIGYVPQRLEIDTGSPATVLDLFAVSLKSRPLIFGHSPAVRASAISALAVLGSQDLIHTRLGALSGGQLQRVFLALALTPTPQILLLDEPVSGVDSAGIDIFYRTVSDLRKQHDLSIIMISHDLPSAARVSDKMIFLDHTVIAHGSPSEVLSHHAVRHTFGLHELSHHEPLRGEVAV